jgi:cytochrome c biogenesis protein CcmG/thiol:disulfide interchange protein DsbE
VLVTSLLAACTSSPSDGGTGIGHPAPATVGMTLDGATYDLSAERGHPVVVNFWASWCVPCRSEFPVIEQGLKTHASDGLTVVGVLFKDSATPARTFVDSFGATWPSITDPSGSLATAYRVVAPPQTYFVDASGVIRGMQIGEMSTEDFERQYQTIAP